ncbi:hypothetical protein RUMHYD_03104 [Blautia hydrogenotrophica DSM 10507]|uniref:Uncharacterized protein n=1 Tax=Blautia hydrogenotrophica (strain DSM 10507 / JCM 14656 / S5a33) TaxID=476272 RepID=C0CQE9_BLAHS|nr:hypothetical protein RUMHYD_03104 [Blautia hydrogenotrophica DSM 10507]
MCEKKRKVTVSRNEHIFITISSHIFYILKRKKGKKYSNQDTIKEREKD